MDLKMLSLALGKISDEVDKLKELFRELAMEVKAIKTDKNKPVAPPEKTEQKAVVEFITLAEIMQILRMSRNTVLGLIRKGLIHEIRFTKRSIRYNKAEVLALAQTFS